MGIVPKTPESCNHAAGNVHLKVKAAPSSCSYTRLGVSGAGFS